MSWNPAEPPAQLGRVFVVTGGNAGLGYFAAEQLAGTGARVVLASRSREKAERAMASIRRRMGGARVEFLELDLSSLESVRRAGDTLADFDRLDGLVLNAGLTSGARTRQTTRDGNELILGTNYLGHFALTARAWPALSRTDGSRVVGLGSVATKLVALDEDDLQSIRRFNFFRAYALSKHTVHGFIFELDRRLRAASSASRAVLAHPGFALDGLSSRRPGVVTPAVAERMLALAAQGKNRGAAPVVRALLDPAARSGDFIGPRRTLTGPPERVAPVASSASADFGRRLWTLSEQWTHEPFAV